jgi:hypothetical protein
VSQLLGTVDNAMVEAMRLAQAEEDSPPPVIDLDAEAEEIRRQAAARRDSSMLGDSGYERIEADFYPTPPENVDCLLSAIVLHRDVWEPACGNGSISQRLVQFGHSVVSTDLHDHGFGLPGLDFLKADCIPQTGVRAIVTNPPYGDLVEPFIEKALELMEPVKGQVAMFLRNEWDCGVRRMSLFGLPPFHKKIVVTKRPRWIAGSTGSPRHNYAWFVWDWRHVRGAASIVYSHPDKAQPLRCA